jgi:hypothetical protein
MRPVAIVKNKPEPKNPISVSITRLILKKQAKSKSG